MALALRGRPLVLRAADKVLYHLSAVMRGNLRTGLAATTAQLWEHPRASRTEGLQAVVAMRRRVVHNLERAGIPARRRRPLCAGRCGHDASPLRGAQHHRARRGTTVSRTRSGGAALGCRQGGAGARPAPDHPAFNRPISIRVPSTIQQERSLTVAMTADGRGLTVCQREVRGFFGRPIPQV